MAVLRRLTISGLALLLGIVAQLGVGAASASAAPGLRFLDAAGAGLSDPRSLVASPDGRSLYAVSPEDDAVLSFRTEPLRFQGCFSANAKVRPARKRPPHEKPGGLAALPPCKQLPGAGTEDAVSGFNGVRFITVSPDGRSVYTVSDDDSIGIFARKAGSGQLNYKGCITGANGQNSAGKRRVCRAIPTATPVHEGIHSGLGGPASLTVSPDNRFVYVAARADAAIAIFAREPNGLLSYRGCLTGGISAFVAGFTSPCTLVAPENSHGSGLRSVTRIVISPDGTSLYASAPRQSAVTEFARDPETGLLSYRGCLSGESRGLGPGNPCRPVPTALEAGFDSGLWLLGALAISADGRSLYGAAKGDDAIAAFSRDPGSGALSYIESEPTLDRPNDLALPPSGRGLYVAATGDAAAVRLARDPGSAALSFGGCLTARRSVAQPQGPCTLTPGLGSPSSLAFAGRTLYAAAGKQDAIARLAIRGD